MVKHLDLGEGTGLVARFESIPESVEQQLAQVNSLAQQLGLKTSYYRSDDELFLWEKLHSQLGAISAKVGVIPTGTTELINQGDALTIVNLSTGLGKLYVEGENALNELQKKRSLCETHKGFLSILAAPAELKQQLEPWGYKGNALVIMKKIKEQFDPDNLLNPGKFVVG